MGCGASKRGKDEVIPLTPMAENALQSPNLKEKTNTQNKGKTSKNNSPNKKEADIFGDTGNDGYQSRKNRDFLELSNISDLPDYQPDNPHLNFGNGELSPIDLNGDTSKKRQKKNPESQHLYSFDQENNNKAYGSSNFGQMSQPQKGKVVRVKMRKDNALIWPDNGKIEVKTISYKVVYSHDIKGFRVLKSKDSYLTSLLTWYKHEEEDIFEFAMKDIAYTNLRTGNSQEINTPQINFYVNYDGKFLGINNLEAFVDSVISSQSNGKITKNKHVQLQTAITKELEKTWGLLVQEWIGINKSGHDNAIIDRRQQFDKDCVLLNKTKVSNDEEYRRKLREKLLDSTSYYKILSSSKMIKDKFKKWELHKESTPRSKNPYLDEDGAASHRNLKLNFISTDKNEVFTTLNEFSTARPFMSSYENSRNIVFEVNKDIYIDVEYESKMSMYLWNDIKGFCSDDFLISEMVKFQDSCDQALGDLLEELSNIPKVPLKFRVENVGQDKRKIRDNNQKIDLSKLR